MQQLLIIGKVWPEPNSSAAGSRTLQLIDVFKEQGWKINFACAAGESLYATNLENSGVHKFNIEINNSDFEELLKTLQPDLVIFDRFTTEEQFGWRVAEICPKALRVLDTIDLHCLRSARQLAVKENRNFVLRDILKLDVAKREIASIYRCDISLMISGVEMEILNTIFKVDKSILHYIPFLLEHLGDSQTSDWRTFSQREHFVSIGNFLHEPNWDAVLYLKKEIWPLLRKQSPKAELHIYGAYASQKVFELHKPTEGFLIKGRAENAMEVMSKARICLAPLRFGAGMKGKLIDAMLCGTPSITSSIGSESMHPSLDWSGVISDSAESFAEAAVHLYHNEGDWKRCQQNGIKIINQVFDKKNHVGIFMEKINAVLSDLENHRQTNFTGAMLQHHVAASTKYMALWIEAKNKTPQ